MSKIEKLTRESWLLNTFPEWGTWLNEEIEQESVVPGTVAMWWLGCAGVWLKTEGNTNICVDFWCGTGKRSWNNPLMSKQHQMMRMGGVRKLQPNLRTTPVVMDPFAIKKIDAVLATHDHSDHIDINVASAVVKNGGNHVKFIGPKSCVDLWTSWGVPRDRCITVRVGDEVVVGDVIVKVLDSFDRTALITVPPGVSSSDKRILSGMDEKSVNYLLKTSGGNIYHSGDSHYSNYYARHGNEHQIDVALLAFGENPRGVTDKMTASDILRAGESLNAKVIIPIHHDIWSNFHGDPREIEVLWKMKKDRLCYGFRPFFWQPGGKYCFPSDKEKMYYQHPRGFHVDEPELSL